MINTKYYEDETFDLGSLDSFEESEFYSCTFKNIKIPKVSFRNSSFIECRFEHCNFSNADLVGSRFKSGEFQDCKLIGLNWCSANSTDELVFNNSVLDFNVFQELKLNHLVATKCSLKECDFSGSSLKKSNFSESNLKSSTFNNANLENADLTLSSNYFIDPELTKIKNIKLSLPEAMIIFKALNIKIE